jgi:alkylation response protein AidB-like acyl-CoA dehydrogenase
VQFGRPIGSFQGVAHPLADSATDIDGAQLLVRRAIWAIAEERSDAAESVALAWWWTGRAAERAALRSVRAFGGYGVSLEYDVQLYFRRIKLIALLLGDPHEHLDSIADRRFDGSAVPLPPAGDIGGMDFGYGAAAEAYAGELRRFVEANMTPEIEKKKHFSTSGHHPGFHKKLAAAGYAFPDLASSDGRPARSRYDVMAAAALWEDMGWTRVPAAVTEMVGKLALLWSQPKAKAEILPRIVAGDALGALGFSEPGAGSDVFAARFSAVRDGEGWLLNGQKMFTTNAHNADYIILLTRTSNEGKKHEGLTMFIMPLRLAGIEIQPVYTLQDERTNIVYFSDVRVSDVYRLGEVGGGAKVMASALQIEQGGSDYHFAQLAMLRRALAWAKRSRANRPAPITQPHVRRVLARAATHSLVAEVLCSRAVWGAVEGRYEITHGQALYHRVAFGGHHGAARARRPRILGPRGRCGPRRGRVDDASRNRDDHLWRYQRNPPVADRRKRARHAEVPKLATSEFCALPLSRSVPLLAPDIKKYPVRTGRLEMARHHRLGAPSWAPPAIRPQSRRFGLGEMFVR